MKDNNKKPHKSTTAAREKEISPNPETPRIKRGQPDESGTTPGKMIILSNATSSSEEGNNGYSNKPVETEFHK